MTYEIEIKGRWVEVDNYFFRSWCGARRVDGKEYRGPVFVLGTKKKFEKKGSGEA